MASPRSTPFIGSLHSDDLLDATAPLDEIVAAPPLANRKKPKVADSREVPSAPAPSWLAWFLMGIAGMLASAALIGATEGRLPLASAIARPAITPPPLRASARDVRTRPAPIHADLQAIPARIDLSTPGVALQDPVERPRSSPRPEPLPSRPPRTTPQPRDELAAALLERRQQLSRSGMPGADVDAVAAIHFDPSRRSARVVYHLRDSTAQLVEYWAVRNGRWQPLND